MNNNRKPNQSRIRRTVAAVLIAAALVVVVGVVLVARCLSFDETGAHVIDRYGVLEMERQQQTGSADVDEETAPEPDPQPEPEQTDATRALVASADTFSDADSRAEVLALAQAGTLDTVIVNIKDDEGTLNIRVDTEQVDGVDDLVDRDAEALEQGIAALKDAGVHVVGRIYCFHDETAAARNADLAMQYEGGGTWLDFDNTRWLDPTNSDTVEYLCDIAHAAVMAGCDEIVLADYTFPPRGHLDRIAFDSALESQAAVLTEDLEQLRQVCGDARVSLTADSLSDLTSLSERGAEDGVSLGDVAALLDAADRLFVPASDATEAAAVIAAVQDTAPQATVVPVFSRVSVWMAYEGDAAVSVGTEGAQAMAVMRGEATEDLPDDETEDGSEDEADDESADSDGEYTDTDFDADDGTELDT